MAVKEKTNKRQKTGGRQKKEVVRVQLHLPKTTVEQIENVGSYLGIEGRPEIIRYLMMRGMENFRVGQSISQNSDMFGKFINAFSEEMDKAAEKVPVPSSTGTAQEKSYKSQPLPFVPNP